MSGAPPDNGGSPDRLSWGWWLVALEAIRRAYSAPMCPKEARIRALAAHRAAAEEARRRGRRRREEKAMAKWEATGDPEAAAYRARRRDEELELHMRREEETMWYPYPGADCALDDEAADAVRYRLYKNYLGRYFESATAIPAMRFTDKRGGHLDQTVQIFWVKVTEIGGGLEWPLDVYGLIAVRDTADRKRNVIFARARDNCQTITEEDPYFTLVGPTRAVVLSDSMRFEVVLKVKGTNGLEDKDLSFLARQYRGITRAGDHSKVLTFADTSRLSTLEWTFGHLLESLEATVNIQVTHGSWPDGFRGVFTASTTSIDDMEVSLLSLEDGKLPVTVDGTINLSRRVACVEIEGGLKISVMAEYANGKQVFTTSDETVFAPRKAGRSSAILKFLDRGSWGWWLVALEAIRRAYSAPMCPKEAGIRAAAAHRAEAVEARRLGRRWQEEKAVRKWVATGDPEAAAYRRRRREEEMDLYRRRDAEEERCPGMDWALDKEAAEARMYRLYKHRSRAFESTTAIPAMRFTDKQLGHLDQTVQIFWVRVAEIGGGLEWPLDVYGLIAIRDTLDRKRNIIFARTRDNCQTITKENPYFTLVGPTRAVVLSDSMRFEVVLKVKDTNELEDKDLSFLARHYRGISCVGDHSKVVNLVDTSRLSTLEWTFGKLDESLEATINIQVIHGSWPDGFRGVFTASTISLDDMEVSLLSLDEDTTSFLLTSMNVQVENKLPQVMKWFSHLEKLVEAVPFLRFSRVR